MAIISAIVRKITELSLNLSCLRCETRQMLCGIPRYLSAPQSPCLLTLTPDQTGKLLQHPMLIALVQETRSPRGRRCRVRSGLPRLPGSLHLMAPGPPQVAGRSGRTAGVRGFQSSRAASDGPEPPYTCGVRPAIPGHRPRPPSPPGPTLPGRRRRPRRGRPRTRRAGPAA